MKYEEFADLKIIEDPKNPFCTLYQIEDALFYIEPAFHTQMLGFKERHTAENYQRIIDEIKATALKNKRVVFTSNFDYPQTDIEGFIYLEITDITDRLQIFVEDKSRGSDYGD